MLSKIRALPPATFVRAIPFAILAALAIGIPADLIDTPIFGRPVEIRLIDYVIWVISAVLIGLILAIRVDAAPEINDADQTRAVWGGFVSFLAVGCPVCNQAVVALIGVSGALNWWAPVQPIIGLAALALLLYALRKRLDTYQLTSCPVPTPVR
jgi:hypothetical protein